MLSLQLLPFVVAACLSAFAVLSHLFDDNLLQRVGLSGICVGSTLTAFVLAKGNPETSGTFVLLGYGLAIYGLGTAIKIRRWIGAHNGKYSLGGTVERDSD